MHLSNENHSGCLGCIGGFITFCYRVYYYLILEPLCPLFLSETTLQNKAEKTHKKRSFGFQDTIPIESMYGIFPYIYHKNQPNVGKYTIH